MSRAHIQTTARGHPESNCTRKPATYDNDATTAIVLSHNHVFTVVVHRGGLRHGFLAEQTHLAIAQVAEYLQRLPEHGGQGPTVAVENGVLIVIEPEQLRHRVGRCVELVHGPLAVGAGKLAQRLCLQVAGTAPTATTTVWYTAR